MSTITQGAFILALCSCTQRRSGGKTLTCNIINMLAGQLERRSTMAAKCKEKRPLTKRSKKTAKKLSKFKLRREGALLLLAVDVTVFE